MIDYDSVANLSVNHPLFAQLPFGFFTRPAPNEVPHEPKKKGVTFAICIYIYVQNSKRLTISSNKPGAYIQVKWAKCRILHEKWSGCPKSPRSGAVFSVKHCWAESRCSALALKPRGALLALKQSGWCGTREHGTQINEPQFY